MTESQAEMQCPACATPLAEGKAEVRGTFWGFLAVGFSMQHLWFHPNGEPKAADIVIQSGASRRALRCPKCRCLVIPPLRRNRFGDVTD